MSNKYWASICFGFSISYEDPIIEIIDSHKDRDHFIASAYDLVAPPEPYEENKQEHREYWEKIRRLKKEIGVEFTSHDVDEINQDLIIHIDSTYKNASTRDSPTTLGKELIPDSKWREMIQQFCERTRIPFQEPEWILGVSFDH